MSDTAYAVSRPLAPSLDAQALYATFAGMCASLVAIGLARFAYTPLIPSLIQAHWFSASQAVALGAANFAGYLIGALVGRRLATNIGNRLSLRSMMLLATVAFFACALPLSVSWFFAWRFASGLAGGVIMVLVAASVLPQVPPARHGLVSGLIFLGAGMGVAASGTLTPWLLHFGLTATWNGLGALALLLTTLAWFGWPVDTAPAQAAPAQTKPAQGDGVLRRLYMQYAANALGLVPAMVLLADFVARGLGWGTASGAHYWALYGLAAIVGPVISGYMVDRIGPAMGYRLSLTLQMLAVGGLAVFHHPIAIALSTMVLGAFTPGIVPLVLGRIGTHLPGNVPAQRAAWSRATVAFALFQALGGYGYAYLFAHTQGNYALIFSCAAAALLFAVALDFGGQRKTSAIAE